MNTNEPMTQARLDAIQARVDATARSLLVRDKSAPYEVYDPTVYEDGEKGDFISYGSCREDDADFILHAYTDVPALLAEVERLREELAEKEC